MGGIAAEKTLEELVYAHPTGSPECDCAKELLEVRRLMRQFLPETYESKEKIILDFYRDVCELAQSNMLKTGKLEGSHYAAMKSVIVKMGFKPPS